MTDWDERYRQADIPWDHGEAAPGIADFLGKMPLRGRVLVPGCGRGHDARLAAKSGADVTGLDISPDAIRQAEAFPKAGNERYLCGDFFHLPTVYTGAFDAILEHTCFCAISKDRRATYAETASRVLKPGGLLVGIFFTHIPDADPERPPLPCPLDELTALFQTKGFNCEHTEIPARVFDSRKDCDERLICWRKQGANHGRQGAY